MAHFSLFPTEIGECGIAWSDSDGLVTATHLPEKSAAQTADYLARRATAAPGEPPEFARQAIELITALLKGQKVDLSVIPCDFSGVEPLAMKVYTIARAIPVGETLTYGEIATQLGNKQLAREVGRLMGRNPFPIVVPCHRVMGANNKLVGFSAYGGIATKQKMLSIERDHVGETLGLFDGLDGS